MTTIFHKNGMKTLQNGNAGIHHNMNQVQNMNYEICNETLVKEEQEETINEEPMTEGIPPEISDGPEIDIVINNVVCSFSVRCHLDLREIALNGQNVEYRRENNMVTMRLRRPYTTASIWSTGKISCTGATSEEQARISARRIARILQKLGFNVRINNYRVVNVLGTCLMPFNIKITSFSKQHREAEYEPELHPGVTYRIEDPKATLKIFSTGSVTVTAPSIERVQTAIEYIYPLVYEFRKERTADEKTAMALKKLKSQQEIATDSVYLDETSSDNIWP